MTNLEYWEDWQNFISSIKDEKNKSQMSVIQLNAFEDIRSNGMCIKLQDGTSILEKFTGAEIGQKIDIALTVGKICNHKFVTDFENGFTINAEVSHADLFPNCTTIILVAGLWHISSGLSMKFILKINEEANVLIDNMKLVKPFFSDIEFFINDEKI